MVVSELEQQFDKLWESFYPNIDLEAEVTIIPKRKFRFDYIHREARVAIEINGGIFVPSGHSTGVGIQRDYEKNNLATADGWAVFLLSSEMINQYWLAIIAETIIRRTTTLEN